MWFKKKVVTDTVYIFFPFLFLDSNTSYLEEGEVNRPPSSDEMDFDALLRLSQKGLQNRKESCRGR